MILVFMAGKVGFAGNSLKKISIYVGFFYFRLKILKKLKDKVLSIVFFRSLWCDINFFPNFFNTPQNFIFSKIIF